MKRVIVTGDKHGNLDRVFELRDKVDLGIGDTIIILGDAGLHWRKDQVDAIANIKKWEETCNGCNLDIVLGNHENYDIIESIPIVNNKRKVSEHINYLVNGNVYDYNGNKCLVCGGADSVDKHLRTKHLSWWPQEQITEADINAARKNARAMELDYIFTHAAPASIVNDYKVYLCTLDLDESVLDRTSENRLEVLKNETRFKHWWFGHYHQDIALNNKFRCLFNSFMEI